MVIVKGVKVIEFNGKKNLSYTFNTKLFTDPSTFPGDERLQTLQNWKENQCDEDNIVVIGSQGGGQGAGGNIGKNGVYTCDEISSMV
mmetsp:Transcript_8757/g.7724  ORF Transcript_8757/g.7724 Transcript_8757/m.7724 type:complete len:87 (+) Transcript_8757:838-1098(+)